MAFKNFYFSKIFFEDFFMVFEKNTKVKVWTNKKIFL